MTHKRIKIVCLLGIKYTHIQVNPRPFHNRSIMVGDTSCRDVSWEWQWIYGFIEARTLPRHADRVMVVAPVVALALPHTSYSWMPLGNGL